MTKIDDEDNGISRCGYLCNLVRPDLAAKDVSLLRLHMHPLSGHVIIRLPGSLPDEPSIPHTTLPSLSFLPILLDLDVRDGRQDTRFLSQRPWHAMVGVSHIPSDGQRKRSNDQQAHESSEPQHQRRHGSPPLHLFSMIEPPADGIGMPQEPFDKIPLQTIDVLRRSKSFHCIQKHSVTIQRHTREETRKRTAYNREMVPTLIHHHENDASLSFWVTDF